MQVVMKKILYIRSGPYQVDTKSYNLQELGLAKAFYKLNIQCDVLYYHARKNYNETKTIDGIPITILWRHGIRLLRSGIYPSALRATFLKQYDAVICSEYSQIMSVLLLGKAKTYIYNGPYYSLFKLPFMEKIYDVLFCQYINKHSQKVFCKTRRAESYLNKKGIINTLVTGVGLDTSKFDNEKLPNDTTCGVLHRMAGHRNLLFIGSISKRKNVELLIRAFNIIKKSEDNNDVQLVLIGKGDSHYVEYCKSLLEPNSQNDVFWVPHIDNAQTKFVYKEADIFLLPSTKEIFGMVLLEAMYFSAPVIASNSAGAETLIENNKNGIIVSTFDAQDWAGQIEKALSDSQFRLKLSEYAHQTIIEKFMWNRIAKTMATNIYQ